jgi:3-oxoacyl-[acyl-carrier protein] reductase
MTGTSDGKVALVSGAATGLGAATAIAFAQAGVSVVAAGLEPDQLDETVRAIHEFGGAATAVEMDVTKRDQIEAAVAAGVGAFGRIDIVVNMAGIYPVTPWDKIPDQEWDDVYAVNVRGSYWVARAAYPEMKRQGSGSVVNVSSLACFNTFPGYAHYGSAKSAVIGLTRTLARELGPEWIRVNAVAPGAIPTRAEQQPNPEAYHAQVLERQSLKRRGSPEDIAGAVVFLASDAASFITGQTLLVDGGWVMQ